MATIQISAIRSRTAAALAALSGWKESRWHADLFGNDPLTTLHKGFAVDVRGSTPRTQEAGRRVGHQLVDTIIGIKWAHKLRADAQITDMAGALDAEAAAVVAVMAMAHTDLSSISLAGFAPRGVSNDGSHIVGDFSIRVTHLYSLT